MPIPVAIAPALAHRVRLGVLELEGLTVREADAGLADEVDRYCDALRRQHAGASSGEVPGVAEARALYKALGLDPTKTRPASEALLRRMLKGEALYRVNTLVDALNLCSLRAQLPFGLYDLDQIHPPVVLRLGEAGEAYEGIRKGPVRVDGRPTLADALGPFGNPTSDSARTMIRTSTRRALVTVFAPGDCPPHRLEAVLMDTEATLTRFSGGSASHRTVLP